MASTPADWVGSRVAILPAIGGCDRCKHRFAADTVPAACLQRGRIPRKDWHLSDLQSGAERDKIAGFALYPRLKQRSRPIAAGLEITMTTAVKSPLGLLGRKVGMTRIFTDDGESVPVTVVDVSDNRVTQVRTVEIDGYRAVQVAAGKRRASRITKPLAGHLGKAGAEGAQVLREFRLPDGDKTDLAPGAALGVDLFQVGQKVDVTGVTIGKGFSGAIKRHHFSSNRASHGNSVSTNAPGSIGMRQDPGRVMPGKRMAGHLGDVQRTTQNLEIARIDAGRQLLLIKGAVPGSRGGAVVVRPAVKA